MLGFIKNLFKKKEEKKEIKIVRKSAAVEIAAPKQEQKEVSAFDIKEEGGDLYVFYNGVTVLQHRAIKPYIKMSLAKVFASTINGKVKTRIQTLKQIRLKDYNILSNDKTVEIEFFSAGYNAITEIRKNDNGIEIYVYHNVDNAIVEIEVSRETFKGIINGDVTADNYTQSKIYNGDRIIKTTATKITITSNKSFEYNSNSAKLKQIFEKNEGFLQFYNNNITKINYCDVKAINNAAQKNKIVELDCAFDNTDRISRTVKAAKIVDTDVILRFSPIFDEKIAQNKENFWVANVLNGKAKADDGEKEGYLIDICTEQGINALKKIITDIFNLGVRGLVVKKINVDLQQINPFDKNLLVYGNYNDFVIDTVVKMAKRYPKTVVYLEGF